MKKSTVRDQEQGGKKRRLTLNRETIKALDDPALLELIRGGEIAPLVPSSSSNTYSGC
jgi:hypothetical protein